MKEFRLIGKALEIGDDRKERLSRTIDNHLDEIDKSLRNGKR